MNKVEKPIIFIGTGRSGTTILSEIIFRHSALGFSSQYHEFAPSFPYLSIVRRVFENRFWNLAGRKKQINNVNWINSILYKPNEGYKVWDYLCPTYDFSRSYLVTEKVTPAEIENIHNYFFKILVGQNRERLVMKLTGPARINFLLQIFPDAQFIHLKRDLVPSINSFLKVDFWKKNGLKKIWWLQELSVQEKKWVQENKHKAYLFTAFQLIKVLESINRESKKIGQDQFLEVAYEEFVHNPSQTIEQILNFLSLDTQDKKLRRYFQNVEIHKRNKSLNEYFTKDQLLEISTLSDSFFNS